MTKKIFDILPPATLQENKLKQADRAKSNEYKKVVGGKKGLIFILLVLILVGIFGYFTLPRANLEIWPETDTLTFKTELTVNKTGAGIIPGKVFTKEATVVENFSSSGRILEEEKAQGVIRVYNEYSTRPQVLRAGTRFVSAGGKLFRTPINVTIPGGRYERGELIPGEIDVKVVADKAGPEYNIEPSTFSIPGFAGTARFTKFYAKSFQSITGGFSREVIQVAREDLEKAERALTERAREEIVASLKKELQKEEISSEFNFLEKAIRTEIVEAFSLIEAGEKVENFDFQVKAKSETILFKKEDLNNFAKEFIRAQIPEEKQIHQPSLKTSYSLIDLNLNDGKMTLFLEMTAKIYSGIDITVLKNALKGKSLDEVKISLENQPAITKTKVEFWPFWVRLAPEDLDKIKIELKFEEFD